MRIPLSMTASLKPWGKSTKISNETFVMALLEWFRAAEIGDVDHIKEKLEEFKGKTMDSGLTALMIAARNHHPHIVAILSPLEHGACDSDGNTALGFAAASDDEESCAVLLQWEKDLALPGGRNPLMVCAENGGVRALSLLLDVYGQGCDALGRTVLEYAIMSKSPRTICIILEYTKPPVLELANGVVKTLSSLETVLVELQETITHLAEEKQQVYQRLKETETALEVSNLGCHNLRCKIRSLEDYTDGIHDILRQITNMESIDDILSCLIDPAFNAEISKYLETNKMASTTSVSTSPFNNILSCSPAELRGNQPDTFFNEELESLKAQLASKDREILALEEKINNNQSTNCCANEYSEHDLTVMQSYMQQISDQKARIERQAEELSALRHLVGSMAIESIADSPKGVSQHTEEQELLLATAKEERLDALQRLRTASERDGLHTIPEQIAQDCSNQFNYSLTKSFESDEEIVRMYQMIIDLLNADSSTRPPEDSGVCGAETLPTLKLFTETVDNPVATLTHVEFDDFKIVLEKLLKRFVDAHKERIALVHAYNTCQPEKSGDRDTRSKDWKFAHSFVDYVESEKGESNEDQCVKYSIDNSVPPITEPMTIAQSVKSSSPPQPLSLSNEYHHNSSEETQLQCIPNGLIEKEEKDTMLTTRAAGEAEYSKPKLLLEAPLRTINVKQEDEELLRCMVTPEASPNHEGVRGNRFLDLERIYSTLNGQDRGRARTHHAETTVVSAVFSSRGVQIKTSKGKTF